MNIDEIKHLQMDKGYSFIVSGSNYVYTSYKNGVISFLYRLLKHQDYLKGAIVYEQNVGKTLATLCIIGKVDYVIAKNMSYEAKLLLEAYDIQYEYQSLETRCCYSQIEVIDTKLEEIYDLTEAFHIIIDHLYHKLHLYSSGLELE